MEEVGVVHSSAGDLLRAHMRSGTEDGNMMAKMINQEIIVPCHAGVRSSAQNLTLIADKLEDKDSTLSVTSQIMNVDLEVCTIAVHSPETSTLLR